MSIRGVNWSQGVTQKRNRERKKTKGKKRIDKRKIEKDCLRQEKRKIRRLREGPEY